MNMKQTLLKIQRILTMMVLKMIPLILTYLMAISSQNCTEKFLNDSRTRIPGQSRFHRLKVVSSSSRGCVSKESECKVIKLGRKGWFTSKGKKAIKVRGEALFIAISLSQKDAEKSSILWDPVDNICSVHQTDFIWVKIIEGKFIFKCHA